MLLRATCAQLMAFPGPKPEVSAGHKVSRDRRTYTFTIRKGFRFNTGEPVTARSYERALIRVLSPAMRVEDAELLAEQFVGGSAFHEGLASKLTGVTANGRTLVFRLTRPWPQLLYDLAVPGRWGCPVPARLPIDPEGVGAPLPGSGPYYISRYVPGRAAVLVRNPLYRGSRPHHVARFEVDLTTTLLTTAQRVIEGKADLAFPVPPQVKDLVRRYGVNRRRLFFFPSPEFGPRMIGLNSRRSLFRNNPELRRAVNYAIDRRALIRVGAGAASPIVSPADHFLTPAVPGFRNVRIYPPGGDLRKARALAKGHTRSGKAVFYVSEQLPLILAQARLVQAGLRKIGIRAEIRTFPHGVFLKKLGTPGEPFDLAMSFGFATGYPDHTLLNFMFQRRYLPPAECCNWFGFTSRRFDRQLAQASRLSGAARSRLYGRLDVELARAAPAVPFSLSKQAVLVSSRAGCHRFDRPLFDLASVCLVQR